MNQNEMTNEQLVDCFKSAWNPEPQDSLGDEFVLMGQELLRRLGEADALRKENEELRYSLYLLVPKKEDGSVSTSVIQRKFFLGFNAASRIADAINKSINRTGVESDVEGRAE